jgi:eukaryotic-like serine/threonine-protein kinase
VPFGPYLLLKRVAVGGMAELFLAKDTRDGKVVVLKRILPYLAEQPEFVKMFLDEARIVSQLHHPNIVELRELGSLENNLFIAMEWVEGTDLRKLVVEANERDERMPLNLAVYVVSRLCAGLDYAHQRRGTDGQPLGIVHRDVSPQNVMVSYTGEVKLVDFGIAKASTIATRSNPGIIKGKFLYLAPEQVKQEEVDHRADLFAVGIVLYELTCGRSPFARSSSEAVIYAIRKEPPVVPRKVVPNYPPGLESLVLRLLEKDPDLRFQSGQEVRLALEGFLSGASSRRIGQAELKAYMDLLYGDVHERTALNVPHTQGEERTMEVAAPFKPIPLATPAPTTDVNARDAKANRAHEELRSIRVAGLADAGSIDEDEDDEPTSAVSRPPRPTTGERPFEVSERTLPPLSTSSAARATPERGRVDYSQPPVPSRELEAVTMRRYAPAVDFEDTTKPAPDPRRTKSRAVPTPVVADEAEEAENDDDEGDNEVASQVYRRPRRRVAWLVGLSLACACIAVAIWAVWPAPPSEEAKDAAAGVEPEATGVAGPTVTPTEAGSELPKVRFEAAAGSVIRVGSTVITAGETRPVEPGPLRVEWTCGAKRRGRLRTFTATFEVAAIGQIQSIQLPCK